MSSESRTASSSSVRRKITAAYQTAKAEVNVDWELVENHLPLVKATTARMRIYFPSEYDIQDLYSIGIGGLISAAKRFDDSRNASFGGFAAVRIKGALLDELRRIDLLPRLERGNVKRFRAAVEKLEQELMREPTVEEIAERLEVSKREARRLRDQGGGPSLVPLDIGMSQDERMPALHEMLSDANQPDSRDVAEKRDLVRLLRDRLGNLPETQRKVLGMYYLKGLRLSEIAVVMELTESRICQIHGQALQTLKRQLMTELSK